MKTTSPVLSLSLSAILLAASAVGCAAEADEATSTDTSAATSSDCGANLTPGTDDPGAEPTSLCIITADLGAKMRSEATAASEDLLASEGWGGLPCGYQLRVDLTDARAAMIGAKANACSVWTHGTAIVNGEKTSGFVNASLLACRRADETNEEFAKRFTPSCTDFSKGSGTSQYQPTTCEPEPGWTKATSHLGVPLALGSGADSALVSTTSRARIAAVFKAYRPGRDGSAEYVGCFKTITSGTYGANVSAAYSLATTEGFYEYEGAVKHYAAWADVDYYVVDGDASIR